MMEAIHVQVPDQCYRVEAWLISGRMDPTGVALPTVIPPADFRPLLEFRNLSRLTTSPCPVGSQAPSCAQAVAAFHDARVQFLADHPAYPEHQVETMRQHEYARLDEQQVTYLDHVGGTLPPDSLLEQDYQALKKTILGNPHSGSKASHAAYQKACDEIYAFFGCTSEEYEIIFTANASSAIRLVAESFPFQQGSQLLLTKDNHTSVHGLREYATSKGAMVKYIPWTMTCCCMTG